MKYIIITFKDYAPFCVPLAKPYLPDPVEYIRSIAGFDTDKEYTMKEYNNLTSAYTEFKPIAESYNKKKQTNNN